MDKLTAVKAFAQTQIEFAKKEFSDDNAPYEMKLKIRGRNDAFQQVVDYIELIEKEDNISCAPIFRDATAAVGDETMSRIRNGEGLPPLSNNICYD